MVTHDPRYLLQCRGMETAARFSLAAISASSSIFGNAFRLSPVPLFTTAGPPAVCPTCPSLLTASWNIRAIATPTGEFESSREVAQEEGSVLESCTWDWRNGFEIHYEHARRDGAPPLVLLPGFGVGTFHFKRNMQELSKTHDVYSMDFLGQGKSWPTRAPSRQDGLCYSVDMWTEQVHAFIERVIGEPAYVAGNSLGGFIGANLAAKHPNSVLGLALLNATPFWAFRQPVEPTKKEQGSDASLTRPPKSSHATLRASFSDGFNEWLRWDGILPAPEGLFRFGAWYFDRMRDPRTVRSMLGAVYSNPEAIGDEVISEIIAATQRGPSNYAYGVGGHEAFTSIVFSPKTSMSFEDMIDRVSVPLALIYGKEDPWVVPLWGHRIKRQRPDTLYYQARCAQSHSAVVQSIPYMDPPRVRRPSFAAQVSPSGHTPHHETPRTVNTLLSAWLEYARLGGSPPLSQSGHVLEIEEEAGVTVRASMVPDALPRGPIEWMDNLFWNINGQGDPSNDWGGEGM